MVTFSIPAQVATVRIKGTRSFFCVCDLDLPDEAREQMSVEDLAECCGRHLLGFYLPPHPGMTFDYAGHLWMVERIHESVLAYRSKGARNFPILTCSYLGKI